MGNMRHLRAGTRNGVLYMIHQAFSPKAGQQPTGEDVTDPSGSLWSSCGRTADRRNVPWLPGISSCTWCGSGRARGVLQAGKQACTTLSLRPMDPQLPHNRLRRLPTPIQAPPGREFPNCGNFSKFRSSVSWTPSAGWPANPPHETGRSLGLISACRREMAGGRTSQVSGWRSE